MKTINQVTNHLITIIPEIREIQNDYDILRKGYRKLHHVADIDADEEHWIITFESGCAAITWEDFDSYSIEYFSDDCNIDDVTGVLHAEIRLYEKFKQDVIGLLESYEYEVYIDAEEYDLFFNLYDDNVSHKIIISLGHIELDEEPSYLYNYEWMMWKITKGRES